MWRDPGCGCCLAWAKRVEAAFGKKLPVVNAPNMAAVKKARVPMFVGFNRRFDPSAQELKRQILAGKIGDVRQVIITSRDPAPPTAAYIKTSGGVFRDMAIHDFDMARFFLEEEPVEVMATASANQARFVSASVQSTQEISLSWQ